MDQRHQAAAKTSACLARARLIEDRSQSGLSDAYEFNFYNLTSAALQERTFSALAAADFEAWALIVDKTTLSDPFRLLTGLDFYLYFVTDLIRMIPAEKRDGSTLILDEFGSAERAPAEIRRVMKARGINARFKRMVVKRSRSEPLIQVADLIAGAIFHRDSRKGSDAFELIEPKMHALEEFRL